MPALRAPPGGAPSRTKPGRPSRSASASGRCHAFSSCSTFWPKWVCSTASRSEIAAMRAFARPRPAPRRCGRSPGACAPAGGAGPAQVRGARRRAGRRRGRTARGRAPRACPCCASMGDISRSTASSAGAAQADDEVGEHGADPGQRAAAALHRLDRVGEAGRRRGRRRSRRSRRRCSCHRPREGGREMLRADQVEGRDPEGRGPGGKQGIAVGHAPGLRQGPPAGVKGKPGSRRGAGPAGITPPRPRLAPACPLPGDAVWLRWRSNSGDGHGTRIAVRRQGRQRRRRGGRFGPSGRHGRLLQGVRQI